MACCSPQGQTAFEFEAPAGELEIMVREQVGLVDDQLGPRGRATVNVAAGKVVDVTIEVGSR